jgi:hypothetical protein
LAFGGGCVQQRSDTVWFGFGFPAAQARREPAAKAKKVALSKVREAL